ncbi:MAG TPA: alpha/beta fold hydrolase [Solirubrobacteraceae bacterium]|nr:alpha/beta fold hydrolase [Solirubrobacteraceae bacterium]
MTTAATTRGDAVMTANVTRHEVTIPTPSGDRLDAWLYLPANGQRRPAVVMAHGIGGIKAAGLQPFAEHFAAAGFAALAFDYRHWGRSEGSPRELLSIARQRDDYRAALTWIRRHDAIDDGRIFIWGTSFAGMHILELAATETELAGAIAQCPLVDGLAAVLNVSPRRALRLTRAACADLVRAALHAEPVYLPISVAPGEPGLIATDDALVGLDRLAPSTEEWPNRITARSLLDITRSRPVRHARRVRCPLLMVVAEQDAMAPTARATRAASRAPRGELYRSRGGHYDVYAGGLDHATVLHIETDFLLRHACMLTGSSPNAPQP